MTSPGHYGRVMPIGCAFVAAFTRTALCNAAQPIVVRFLFPPLAVSVNVGRRVPAYERSWKRSVTRRSL